MGLLDLNLDTGDPLANAGLVGGLLSARVGDGSTAKLLFQAAQMKQQQQNQERLNRANDLQQLQGAYSMLRQQEFAKMAAAKQRGEPYMPNPMLPQMEAKLAELTGLGNLSGKLAPAAQVPPAPIAPPTVPPAVASQYSPVVRPELRQQGPMPQAPQPQQDGSGFGGPAGGIPMEVWLAQDATGKTYLEQLAKDNQPIALRQGDLVKKTADGRYVSAYQQPPTVPGVLPTRDNNGQVTAFREGPGFAQAAANIKGTETGATEQAKAPYDIKMVTMADGRTVPVPVSQLAGKTPSAAGLPFVQQPPGVAKLTVTEPSRQSQIPSSANDPFADIPKIPQPSGVGQSTYDANMAKLRGDQAAKLFETYGNAADDAQKRMAINNQALSLLDRSETGTGAPLLGDIKKLLVTRFGIPEEDFAKDPTATSVVQKDLLNAATAKAKQTFGARMTQSEVMMMLKRGAPNIDMTTAAIKFLLDTDNTQAQYDIQRANHFGEYISRGGDPLRFQGYYSNKFPLTKQEETLSLPKGNGSVDDLVNKYRSR